MKNQGRDDKNGETLFTVRNTEERTRKVFCKTHIHQENILMKNKVVSQGAG